MSKSEAPPVVLDIPPATPPTPDPYWGQGGSYTRDPATGKRTLVQRTEQCADCILQPSKG
ncbi:hypothetical protein ERD78_18855 [Allopusillimonas soli]|uniref:Uncharacterized protein n=1 Tax=Allopusillimonas soli TaxID=659016 RepID=A0A853FGV5_9BURK|nr:hypothetical protein [Allopusillimonas soli]NYT38872.1 hypothetical protein [Allopusillimonas soli]TEA70129.1 hypothetical protein ERD78_18855 [Allopusillimonas soli]